MQGFTEAEEGFIRESLLLGLEQTELRDRFWKQFGTGHSSKSLRNKTQRLATAGGVPAKKNAFWTAEEEQFLADWPHQPSTGLATAFHAKFGSDRSVSALATGFSKMKKARNKEEEAREDAQGGAAD
ncbi:hypothetical protein F53441_847 [Fusarium austroafricanum]|uniref:Uncharacterized protein n=1 Tax=Fusarium austroafricanum TaxID=2364996 RepID=A0A8H4KWV9_9HYPO|nr:hypothetical protein F53441_847 [Fusarium austroafricanum]